MNTNPAGSADSPASEVELLLEAISGFENALEIAVERLEVLGTDQAVAAVDHLEQLEACLEEIRACIQPDDEDLDEDAVLTEEQVLSLRDEAHAFEEVLREATGEVEAVQEDLLDLLRHSGGEAAEVKAMQVILSSFFAPVHELEAQGWDLYHRLIRSQ